MNGNLSSGRWGGGGRGIKWKTNGLRWSGPLRDSARFGNTRGGLNGDDIPRNGLRNRWDCDGLRGLALGAFPDAGSAHLRHDGNCCFGRGCTRYVAGTILIEDGASECRDFVELIALGGALAA